LKIMEHFEHHDNVKSYFSQSDHFFSGFDSSKRF
jgi:hypothetical protein